MWDISTGKHRHTLNAHNKSVRSITIHNDSLISASDDETIKVKCRANITQRILRSNIKRNFNVTIPFAIKYIIIYCCQQLWDVETWKCTNTIQLEKNACEVKVASKYLIAGFFRSVKVMHSPSLNIHKHIYYCIILRRNINACL
mgnify:CR=1 FL=1